MISLVGLFIAIIAGINTVFSLVMYLLFLTGTESAKFSKKIRTDNHGTDNNIAVTKQQSKVYLKSFLIRASITLLAYLVYVFAPK